MLFSYLFIISELDAGAEHTQYNQATNQMVSHSVLQILRGGIHNKDVFDS